jgi:hypothetical protein
MAALNAARYGSPLASGYGSTDVLFSFAHVGPNLARYPRWLLETETPLVAAAMLAPWWAWRRRAAMPLVFVLLAAIGLTAATYLAYTVFDDWWYVRFLLPALAPLIILSVAVCRGVASRLRVSAGVRDAVLLAACGAIAIWHVHVASTHHVFELQALESRFALTGAYVGRALPASAVVIAVQQSGSVRYHGGRATIAWDAITPGTLDATIAALAAAGRRGFLVLEDGEEPGFRARFAGERAGMLDWPPRAEVHAPVRVRVYDPEDRAVYRSGARIETEHIR